MKIPKHHQKLALVAISALLVGLFIGLAAMMVPRYFQMGSSQNGPSPQEPTKQAEKPGTDEQIPATPTPPSQATEVPQTPAPENRVILYDQVPGATKSPLLVQVNGQDVFVEQYKDIHYARFAFTGTAKIRVTSPNAANYTISPKGFNIEASKNGDALEFLISEPRKLILQGNGEKLFLFADPPEEQTPQPGTPKVIDVSTYVTDTSGKTAQTAEIQRAIDDASAQQGTVYFPAGTYLSGILNVKSNVSLYLASGALLRGISNASGFGEGHFLLFENVSNARLYGRGVIDLGGIELRKSAGDDGRVKIIRTIQAKNIEIHDVLLRDAGSWTVHFVGSDNIKVTNLKIINDMTNTNGDGIDPDSSTNVEIDGAFMYTTDDCFAIKTSGTFKVLKPTNNILIKNAVCYSKKSALKVGTETRANLSNITFENNHVVHADRVISLYMADGSTMENITYTNNFSEEVGGDSKERLIDINITQRKGLGHIKNVVINNHMAYQPSPNTSAIAGTAGHEIDVQITNLTIAGQPQANLADAGIEVEHANVTFEPNS